MKACEDEHVRALETLLARRRSASSELLSMDGYDRWGAATDTPENRARMEASAARASVEHREVTAELAALVERLRLEAPASIERWADAHDAFLAGFIEACAGAEPSSHAAVGEHVARRERAEWAAVKQGEKAFVDENVYYISRERERYLALFGVEP
jgi:hypothetical protein